MNGAKRIAVVGSQWGDEGKGKIIDYLAKDADMVVRAQGGANAGHTVVINDKKYTLHLIPSGILNPGAVNIIGNGVVFDPEGFFGEIDTLNADGVDTSKIYVSDRAHVVMPYHKTLDALAEKARGEAAVGTTLKGIGPCYMDKAARSGIRVIDLLDDDELTTKISAGVAEKNALIEKIHNAPDERLDAEMIIENYRAFAKRLKPYVADTGILVREAVAADRVVLFEGAQGSMLDLDLGTYPYVTSSHPISGGFTTGAGIGPRGIDKVVSITKAYTTRVGAGPFVTELANEIGDAIRERGHEYGATTGRPRRCGWFDALVVRYTAGINGTDCLALTLLDVLGDFDDIYVCTAYEHDGVTQKHYPASLKFLGECKPVYTKLKGWKTDISGARDFEELPAEAKDYIAFIEEACGVPVAIVSVGSDREQTIIREGLL